VRNDSGVRIRLLLKQLEVLPYSCGQCGPAVEIPK
jgi:hypothetical protein